MTTTAMTYTILALNADKVTTAGAIVICALTAIYAVVIIATIIKDRV